MEMTFGPVRLLLGARYGKRQASGLSATNEEYREAKTRCRVLAFVQRDVDRGAHHQQARVCVNGRCSRIIRARRAQHPQLAGDRSRCDRRVVGILVARPSVDGECANDAGA